MLATYKHSLENLHHYILTTDIRMCLCLSYKRSNKLSCVLQGGYTAFMWATWHGHVGIATLLLDRGARIDIADKVSYCTLGVQVYIVCDR